MGCIVYSPRYNLGFYGVERLHPEVKRLHPFDARKYGRAWRVLRRHFGRGLSRISRHPQTQTCATTLQNIHSAHYISSLRQPTIVATALEIPLLRSWPAWAIDRYVLRPMRWATAGTILAAQQALRTGFAVNLGGGFHHAKPDHGEGFCVYADIALAVDSLRQQALLSEHGRVAYIDLDAHQGNGVCHCFRSDDRVFIFDMYNSTIYPLYDTPAQDRIDCNLRLTETCTEKEYLNTLHGSLEPFLDSISKNQPVELAIYNAGTDVLEGDPLGGLHMSADGIKQRDKFVVEALNKRGVPTVMLLSGGYTRESYRVIAESIISLLS